MKALKISQRWPVRITGATPSGWVTRDIDPDKPVRITLVVDQADARGWMDLIYGNADIEGLGGYQSALAGHEQGGQ